MGLTMSERKAVTKTIARRYRGQDRAGKKVILDELGELRIGDETATAVCKMSAATIDRRLAPDRAKLQVRGRSHTKPGSLLKDSIPMRTWADSVSYTHLRAHETPEHLVC